MTRWFALRLDFIVNLVTVVACIIAIQLKENPAQAGLAITYTLQLAAMMQFTVRSMTEAESQVASVERIMEYAAVPMEAARVTPFDEQLADWPSSGQIDFEDFDLRYRDDLPKTLCSVNLHIKSGERIGVVGRTGAGKSTLVSAIFRLIEASGGSIRIDRVDISRVGLAKLRSSLAIIPQDPVLFSGTMRSNLDPFNRHTNDELLGYLEKVQLMDTLNANGAGLEMRISENGTNLSVGERQLVCIARAMMRRAKVLILDEATSNIDNEMDGVIQKLLRGSAFAGCTIIAVAHRLETVIDCDRVLVLDKGVVMENDTPANLVEREGSRFNGLLQATGAASARHLRRLATSNASSRPLVPVARDHVDGEDEEKDVNIATDFDLFFVRLQ